ncbi:MAG TPA: hypothetical protein VKA67_01935, partial [Verrucomicrobiae bacterium]|nr:hypothetical protein [Verrucomicrobiae bacterium]
YGPAGVIRSHTERGRVRPTAAAAERPIHGCAADRAQLCWRIKTAAKLQPWIDARTTDSRANPYILCI